MKLRVFLLALLIPIKGHAACGAFSDVMLFALNGSDPAVASDTVTGIAGTPSNLTVATACVGGTNCRSFNGVSSSLTIPYGVKRSNLPANTCLRVSAYIKPSGGPPVNGDDVIRNNDFPNERWKVEISDADAQQHIRCEAKGAAGGTVVATGGPSLYDGKWHQVVCRIMRSPDALEAWVSTCLTNACTETAVMVARVVAPIGSITSGNPLTVGRHPPPDNAGWYTGLMDSVTIRQAVEP
jgi:hypothetical protein